MATETKRSAADTAPAPTQQVDKKAEAAACFKANPKAELLYQTSDGQCFGKEADAKGHAKRLGDKEVSKVTPQSEETEAEPEEDKK